MYQVDSKVVSAALRMSMHPFLRTAGGFTKLKARDAWRFDEHTTSVVDFASLPRHRGESAGCTTFSFSVQLGVFLRLGALQPSGKPEAFLPKEYECPIRIQLAKSLRQTEASDAGLFFVAADGSNEDPQADLEASPAFVFLRQR